MLLRTDPFRDLDRLTRQLMGTSAGPNPMPLDARRDGDTFVIELDLPGVDPGSIDLDIERNALTVRAERPLRATDAELLIAERPYGVFTRQLVLGDALDTEQVQASYDAGVLRLAIPIAEKAKPRKTAIDTSGGGRLPHADQLSRR